MGKRGGGKRDRPLPQLLPEKVHAPGLTDIRDHRTNPHEPTAKKGSAIPNPSFILETDHQPTTLLNTFALRVSNHRAKVSQSFGSPPNHDNHNAFD